jgi:hypothetical protein
LGITASASINANNCEISNNGLYGIYASGVSIVSIKASTFTNNWRGVYALGVITLTLTNSSFTNNGNYAAYLSFNNAMNFVSSGNSGSGNRFNGIGVQGSLASNTTLFNNPNFPYIVPTNLL